MDSLTSIANIRTIMRKYDFAFSKKMGQNFIINPGICSKIASLGGVDKETGVIEIGPGIGVLTRELSLLGKKVVAIELDHRLIPVLAETLKGHTNVKVINADALKIDLHRLIREEFAGMRVVVCANLPYYITSPIVMKLLEDRLPVHSITVMVQKEAAQRICAPMPSRQSGAITAAIRYYTEPKILFDVSPGSFMPAPEVHSSVIRLDLLGHPPVEILDEKLFFSVVRAAFSQRRKTLLNCLSTGLGLPKAKLTSILNAAEIPPNARAEQLSIDAFAAIANNL